MPISKPAGSKFHVLATELSFGGGPPNPLVPLTWSVWAVGSGVSPSAFSVVQDADGLGATYDLVNPAALSVTVNFQSKAALGSKIGLLDLQYVPNPNGLATITLSVDPAVDP